MTYYLSGPMSGIPEFNFPAFDRAAKELRRSRYTIVSPHEKPGEGDPTKPYVQYLKEDLLLLATCDALILLPGWPTSTGARMELEIALTLKLPIYFYYERSQILLDMQTGSWHERN